MGTIVIIRDFRNTGGGRLTKYFRVNPGRIVGIGTKAPSWMSIQLFVESMQPHEHILYDKCVLTDAGMKTLKAHDVMRSL